LFPGKGGDLQRRTADEGRPVPLRREAGRYAEDVKGTARINMNEFGIKTPTYVGVSVKPDVDVNTRFLVKDD
jgi:hypothetical protein